MRFIWILCICLINTPSGVFGQAKTKITARQPVRPVGMRVVGYIPDHHAAGFDPNNAVGLTDLNVFSAQPTPEGGLDLSRFGANRPWAKFREFKTRERVRMILTVGGWGHSTHFAAVATTAALRQKFANTAVQVCLEHRFDGLDLDWEHPKDAAEQNGYGQLLTEIQTAFKPHGLVLSVTIAGWQGLSPEAIAAVDWVNLMAYDHPGRHSTLESAQVEVKKLLDLGIPPQKLNLGLPFYGRKIMNRELASTYREIVEKYHPAPETDEVDGIYFNGPATIRRKTEWAMKSKLGGVMIWELGQDVSGKDALLPVIRDTVARPSQSKK